MLTTIFFTSWGGTLKDTVRRSTLVYDSMQGKMKNMPAILEYFNKKNLKKLIIYAKFTENYFKTNIKNFNAKIE